MKENERIENPMEKQKLHAEIFKFDSISILVSNILTTRNVNFHGIIKINLPSNIISICRNILRTLSYSTQSFSTTNSLSASFSHLWYISDIVISLLLMQIEVVCVKFPPK